MVALDRLSSPRFAIFVVVANLVCCTLVGGAWLVLDRHAAGSSPQLLPEPALQTPTPTPPLVTVTSTPGAVVEPGTSPIETTTPAGVLPDALERVNGPAGLVTAIPQGWPTQTLSEPGTEQATDPADSQTILRYGGAPPTDGTDMWSYHVAYEQQIAKHAGYVRDELTQTSVRGGQAVDWEFEWDAPEGRRHVQIVYWRAGGIEYFVYFHCSAVDWPANSSLVQTIVDASTP